MPACSGPCGPCGGVSCCGCTTNPTVWVLTLSGFGDAGCEDCADMNATWNLTRDGAAACSWTCATGHPCFDPFTLECDGIDWLLTLHNQTIHGGNITYSLAAGSFTCNSSNTLSLDSNDQAACTGTASASIAPL